MPEQQPLTSDPALDRAVAGTATALLFIAVAVLAVWRLDDPDTWWHLATGRYIVAHQTIPTHDVFSFTASQRPWIDLQWLFDLLAFAVFSLGGVPALTLTAAALAVTTFGVLYRVARPAGRLTATLSLVLPLLVAHERFMVRPEIGSFVLFAVYLALLEAYPRNGRWIWIILPLQVLWVNFHAVFVAGLVLLESYAAGRSLMRVFSRSGQSDPSGLGRLWMVGAAAAVVCLINPYATRGALFPLTLLTRISTERTLYGIIGEFYSPFTGSPSLSVQAYEALIAVTAASFLFNWRALRWDRLLPWVAFLALSVSARRNMGFFALLSVPIVADAVAGVGCWLAARKGLAAYAARGRLAIETGLGLALAVLIVLVVSNRFFWSVGDPRREFGLRASSIDFPVGAADFLERAGVTGNLFNDLHSGGYLTWHNGPERKVFIDGRLEVYDEEFFARYVRVLNQPAEFEALAEQYDINAVLLFHVWPNRGPLIFRLLHDDNWRLAYFDANAIVLVRNRPENLRVAQLGADQQRKELADSRGEDLDQAAPGWWSGFVAPVQVPQAHVQKGNLLLLMSQPEAARREFEAALRARPRFAEARVGLGYAQWDAGEHAVARAQWQEVLRLDPYSAPALEALRLAAGQDD